MAEITHRRIGESLRDFFTVSMSTPEGVHLQ